MSFAFRRLLAAVAVSLAVLFGAPAVLATAAPTPTPTPHASASKGATSEASASDDDDSDDADTPDTAPDNSRMFWVLGGAGLLAVAAAAVVIARR